MRVWAGKQKKGVVVEGKEAQYPAWHSPPPSSGRSATGEVYKTSNVWCRGR